MSDSIAARLAFAALCLISCSASTEAPRVTLAVAAAPLAPSSVTTAQGYVVTIDEARVAVHDLTFAVGGEVHTALFDRVSQWLVPRAYAHPGHYQGGAITGELPGRFVLDFFRGSALGDATLIVGSYESVNIGLRLADADDATVDVTGHTAFFRGTATRGSDTFAFRALIDSPLDREINGVPFEAAIATGDSGKALTLELLLEDPYEHDTLFDGLDFAALDDDADKVVVIAPTNPNQDAYDRLRRTFQTHDHFRCRRAAQD